MWLGPHETDHEAFGRENAGQEAAEPSYGSDQDPHDAGVVRPNPSFFLGYGMIAGTKDVVDGQALKRRSPRICSLLSSIARLRGLWRRAREEKDKDVHPAGMDEAPEGTLSSASRVAIAPAANDGVTLKNIINSLQVYQKAGRYDGESLLWASNGSVREGGRTRSKDLFYEQHSL